MLFLALCDLIYMRTFLFYYTESVKKCQCCLGVFFFFFSNIRESVPLELCRRGHGLGAVVT